MDTVKCTRCGFISYNNATACQRCGATITAHAHNTPKYQHQSPPQPWMPLNSFALATISLGLFWVADILANIGGGESGGLRKYFLLMIAAVVALAIGFVAYSKADESRQREKRTAVAAMIANGVIIGLLIVGKFYLADIAPAVFGPSKVASEVTWNKYISPSKNFPPVKNPVKD